MTNALLISYLIGVLLIASPFIIDTIKQERKLNKKGK